MGLGESLTKHSDWQPIPKKFRQLMPYCPICERKTKWNIYDKHGWTERGYKVVCDFCKAEWESTTIDSKTTGKTILVGPIFSGALSKSLQFPNPNSVLILQKIGNSPQIDASSLIGENITLTEWSELEVIDTIFCNHCGSEIDEDSDFCTKCGRQI